MHNESRLGWIYGFALLGGIYSLAAVFGLGHVEEKTSYGLKDVLDILKSLITFWAGWKFSRPGVLSEPTNKEIPRP
jgi:hypothetical protein